MRRPEWELAELDGVGQAELVQAGTVTPRELAEAALLRIEALDGELNSVIWKMDDLDAQLDRIDNQSTSYQLPGVPTLLKDQRTHYKGAPQWDGSRLLEGVVAGHDSELVIRMRDLGLTFLGKSASSEFGNGNEATLRGPSHNPWNTEMSTGGSSAGAGAAVAARLVPIAQGSDSGGSIRWPAAWCGLFGMKPSRARNPLGPDGSEGTAGLPVSHVLTWSVRDSAVVLDGICGTDTGAPFLAPTKIGSYYESAQQDPKPLRIGFSLESPDGQPVDLECVAATRAAAKLCEELGHHVEEAVPSYDAAALVREFDVLTWDSNAATADAWRRKLGREATDRDIEPLTWMLMERGRGRTASDHINSVGNLRQTARHAARFFGDYDIFLSPTTPTPPVNSALLTPTADNVDEVWMKRELGGAAFLLLANVTGHPAMSVPLHWTPDGLPVGAHFMAGSGREDVLFQLAGQLERAQPWQHRVPPMVEALRAGAASI